MKKITISKLFLYKYRFIIGYTFLGILFLVLLFGLPFIAQNGLSNAEMESATTSFGLKKDLLFNNNLVDLPYHLLQKLSIMVFGLTTFAIKLPSIVIAIFLGFLLILLLNRWFKNNVSLLTSCLVILSTPFLFLAGSGTPLIMLVFWPTLLLWLGSKIQGEKRPKPAYCILFAIATLLSIFTPYMIYFAIFCILFVLFQPHLRFVIKTLPKAPLIFTGIIILSGLAVLVINVINKPDTMLELLFAKNFNLGKFFTNIKDGFIPVFSWHNNVESVFLSPLISLPIFSIIAIGLLSTAKGFFASRNSIALILTLFTVAITGFNPNAAIFCILPFSILIAHGLKYLLEKWYGLFPENPYARISALFPLFILFSITLIPGLLQYIYGYRYSPNIANEFTNDLSIIRKTINDKTLYVQENYDFYKILQESTNIKIINEYDLTLNEIAVLGKPEKAPEKYVLQKIITSSKSDNSDRIYLYKKGE